MPFVICEAAISGLSQAQLVAKLRGRTCHMKLGKEHGLLSATNAAQVRGAVAAWNARFGANIRFEEVDQKGAETHIVRFVRAPKGACGTRGIGYNWAQQIKDIRLKADCLRNWPENKKDQEFLSPYTIMHEMMHAIGIHHEQSRSDRNQYFVVDLGVDAVGKDAREAQESDRHQYEIAGRDLGNYDFASVMHYGLKLKRNTIYDVTTTITVRGSVRLDEQRIGAGYVGQRVTLSPDDEAAIKALYP